MTPVSTTEALVLRKNGEPLQLETINVGSPGEDQAIVEIYATGLCHTDLTCMSAHVPFPTPSVLGHEGEQTMKRFLQFCPRRSED